MLLAIDTATRVMSLALHDGRTLLSEQSWHIGNQHTVELTPAVWAMLASCGASVDDLSAVAVAIGPGSYTGLRIGVAFAKGLATPHSLPLVGVNTLDILAAGQSYYQSGVGLISVVKAGRGRIYVNSYRWRKGRWNSHTEPRLMDWEKLLETIDGPAHVTGEIDDDGLEILKAARENNTPISIAKAAQCLRRAGYLAELSWEKLNDAGDDKSAFAARNLLPIYIQAEAKA